MGRKKINHATYNQFTIMNAKKYHVKVKTGKLTELKYNIGDRFLLQKEVSFYDIKEQKEKTYDQSHKFSSPMTISFFSLEEDQISRYVLTTEERPYQYWSLTEEILEDIFDKISNDSSLDRFSLLDKI